MPSKRVAMVSRKVFCGARRPLITGILGLAPGLLHHRPRGGKKQSSRSLRGQEGAAALRSRPESGSAEPRQENHSATTALLTPRGRKARRRRGGRTLVRTEPPLPTPPAGRPTVCSSAAGRARRQVRRAWLASPWERRGGSGPADPRVEGAPRQRCLCFSTGLPPPSRGGSRLAPSGRLPPPRPLQPVGNPTTPAGAPASRPRSPLSGPDGESQQQQQAAAVAMASESGTPPGASLFPPGGSAWLSAAARPPPPPAAQSCSAGASAGRRLGLQQRARRAPPAPAAVTFRHPERGSAPPT